MVALVAIRGSSIGEVLLKEDEYRAIQQGKGVQVGHGKLMRDATNRLVPDFRRGTDPAETGRKSFKERFSGIGQLRVG